jgi:hypothetical protein
VHDLLDAVRHPGQGDEAVVARDAVLQDLPSAHLDAAGPVLGVDDEDAGGTDDEVIDVRPVVWIGSPPQVVEVVEARQRQPGQGTADCALASTARRVPTGLERLSLSMPSTA